MKLNKHVRARPNIAGLTSPVQQAELKLLLAGGWPPLKPLPVFKYETDEYRASIDFDKTRGEWVCRKTSLPSNKVQELRGGLTELTMALPHGQADVCAESAAAEQPEQELEKHASRRLQAILEWKENFENGALYSGLQDYLSESQQDEIDDSIQLTLTARQLQFNPKNLAYVFDALSKAGGKLATLIEIAQRNKREQGANVPANAEVAARDAERHASVEALAPTSDRRLQTRTTPASRAYVELGATTSGIVLNISQTGMAVASADPLVVDDYLPRIRFQLPSSGQSIEISARIVWLAESKKSAGIQFIDLTAEARNQVSDWIASEKPAPAFEGLTPAPVESLVPATLRGFPEESIGSVFLEQDQPSLRELTAQNESPASKIVTPEILDEILPSFVEDPREKVHFRAPLAGFGQQVRTSKVESSVHPIQNSPSRLYALEISGFQVAAVVFLFAGISLAVVLTVGRGPLGKRPRDTQKSIPAVGSNSPARLNRPRETTSRVPTPPVANTFLTPEVSPPAPPAPAPVGVGSESPSTQSLNAPLEDSAKPVGPPASSSAITTRPFADSDNLEAGPERKGSNGLVARNARPRANSQPVHSSGTVGPITGAPAKPASRRIAPTARAAPHPSSPSTILVTGPGDGSKPFRLTLPEKPIAASSSFAMTSQLSVLILPERGPAPAHRPARLQAGELVSFVWPRYPRPGDRHGSSETVKVRTTIGELGQVLDVKHVSGSISLLPAATSAIRLWRYKPTLLNRRPVQAQLDVTVEFRPPQHLPRVRTRHFSHN
ncbi:MAG TPA: PilZ domain-containing protein [Candidatus Acidoferrum sp.]|nr:PilZ domain-containing protein [Candidatus Acidoferrum sp.]